MLYPSADAWRAAPHKHVLVFGMSGLGKTHMAHLLRQSGGWFHYSIDYRIGTRYLGETIADNAKAEAMKVPFLRDLLLSDSIYIGSNITFDNLSPVATWLGKPGDAAKGGLPMAEYASRQEAVKQPCATPAILPAVRRRFMGTRISSVTPAARSVNGWTPMTTMIR